MRKFASIIACFNPKGELLLGQRKDNGKFTVPGGHREGEESPEETAYRELKEEAGIEPEELCHLGEGMVRDGDQERHVHVFKVVSDAKPTTKNDPDDEVKEWQWVPVNRGLPKEIYKNLHVPAQANLLFPLCDVDLIPEDFDDENFEDEKGREYDLEKSLEDIPRGKKMLLNHLGTHYAYNHVLPKELLDQGYRVVVRHASHGGVMGGPNSNQMTASVQKGLEPVGTVGGNFNPDSKKLEIRYASFDDQHRGKGLGKAAYEALMAHAYHAGAKQLVGGHHATAASAVHSSLARKHGFEYKPQYSHWTAKDRTPDVFDERFGAYEYALKAEICQFNSDVLAWCVFNEPLNKSLKHSLMGLAAASMLSLAPSTAQAPPGGNFKPSSKVEEPVKQPLPEQLPNKHMNAVIKHPLTLQPKNVGMTGDQGQSISLPAPKLAAKNYSMAWHSQGLPKEMLAISRNESYGGRYWNHEKNQAGPFWTAYGPLGMKPATAYDEFRQPHMAAVRRAFPGLENPYDFLNEFRLNPNLYNAVATSHWNRLRSVAGGDDELAAYGWNQGVGALQDAVNNGQDVSEHEYVQNYRNNKAKLFGEMASK